MEDCSKYSVMRDHGVRAEEVFRQARQDGFDTVACLRIVRQVFNLSLIEGKALTFPLCGFDQISSGFLGTPRENT